MSTSALATTQNGALAVEFNRDELAAIRAVYGKGLNDAEFTTFQMAASHNGYDIAKGEYIAIRTSDKLTFFATVHGIVNKAHRNPLLEGIEGPFWCGPDGK